jgi:hypothetical protein
MENQYKQNLNTLQSLKFFSEDIRVVYLPISDNVFPIQIHFTIIYNLFRKRSIHLQTEVTVSGPIIKLQK